MERYLAQIFGQMTDFEREIVIRSVGLLNKAIAKTGTCCYSG